MLDGKTYEAAVASTAFYPYCNEEVLGSLMYVGLGLTGEAGEVAEKLKKMLRDADLSFTDAVPPEKKMEILKELGDVLWYVTRLAREMGYSLDDVATANIEKLSSRAKRNVLKGDGDNR